MTELFRAIFDATVDAIVVVDAATHTIVEANAQALVDSGYRLDELEGVAIDCLFPSLGRLLASVRGRDDQARGISCSGCRLITKRGEAIAVDARVTPIELDEGHYFVIVARRIAGTPNGDQDRPRGWRRPGRCGLSWRDRTQREDAPGRPPDCLGREERHDGAHPR